MFCQKCGVQLPDDAQFCMQCGQSQRQAIAVPSTQYELCEVIIASDHITKGNRWIGTISYDVYHFQAQVAGGTNAAYIIAHSEPLLKSQSLAYNGVPDATNTQHVAACEKLVQVLKESGWEPVGEKGYNWWSYKFRRPIPGQSSSNTPHNPATFNASNSLAFEHCTILYQPLKSDLLFGRPKSWRFEAEAIGPKGTYMASCSQELSCDHDFIDQNYNPAAHNRQHKAACDNLMRKLISEGWELTGEKGPDWWSYKFRRKLV